MRGLKLAADDDSVAYHLSHPTWVRGLKLINILKLRKLKHVAPYVGAWIETLIFVHSFKIFGSHPTWVRGLKPVAGNDKYKTLDVAPYVGAWIETR